MQHTSCALMITQYYIILNIALIIVTTSYCRVTVTIYDILGEPKGMLVHCINLSWAFLADLTGHGSMIFPKTST